jgi:CDP-diacylglycerol--serine O-phosphatidyltransferase
MPIPAGAGVISSVIHLQRGSPIDNSWIALVWLCLLLGTSFLMVSNWRFWSAKEITSGSRHPFQLFALIGVIGALIVLFHQYMLFILAMAYLVSGVVARLAYSWSRERRHSTVVS